MRYIYVLFLSTIVTTTLFAQVPRQFSYQGLIEENGVPFSGTATFQVSIYDSIQGGLMLFSDQFNVNVANGVFNIAVGSGLPLPTSLDFSKPYFLGISINGGTELPRTPILSAPYSLHSSVADTALAFSGKVKGVVTDLNGLSGNLVLEGAGTTTVNLSSDTLLISSNAKGDTGIQGVQNLDGSLAISDPNGPIATIGIADSAITTKFLANNAVTTSRISDGAVTGGKIAQATVTTENISTQGAASGTVLTALGSSTPNWQLVNLASSVTGTLPVANGGTGQNAALVLGGVLYGASATAVGSSQAGTSGQVLTSGGATQPTWQTPSFVQSGSLIAFPDSSSRSGYTYTGSAQTHEGWASPGSPYALAASCAATLGGKIYFLGGWNNSGNTPNFLVYDPSSNTWTSKGGLPNCGYGASTATIGSKIYLVGGRNRQFGLESMDSASGLWTTLAPLPHGSIYGATAASGGLLFVFAPCDTSTINVGSNLIEIYNPTTNTWAVDSDTSGFNPRRCACAAAVNGKIYVFGGLEHVTGSGTDYPSNEVLEYFPGYPSPSTWTFKSSSGFTPREQASCAVIDSAVYIFGGTIADGTAAGVRSAVEVYDVLRDKWNDIQQIGWTRRQQSASADIGGKIYVYGGHQSGPNAQALSTFEVLNPYQTSLYWFKKN